MSLDKKKDTVPIARESRRERFKKSLETVSGKKAHDVIEELAVDASSASDIVGALESNYGIKTTIPTVLGYLQVAWGKDYDKRMEDMKKSRINRRRWTGEYEQARQGVSPKFFRDYLSTDDGIYFDFEENRLQSLPELTKRAHRGKNIINYSKERDFGWSRDEKDLDALGSWDASVLGVVIRQLERRVDGLIEDKKKELVKRATLEKARLAGITPETIDQLPEIMRNAKREAKAELADELDRLNDEKSTMMFDLVKQLGKGDVRTRFLHGGDVVKEVSGKLMSANLDPAYASSDKKFRGKQRMIAVPGETFSRATYNLPFLLHMHPKRLQVHSHNLSKKLPELLKPETPRVPARFNDVHGVNARIRFPRNTREHIETLEAGMIVTTSFANRFRYFTVVEEGVLIGETKQSFPDAPRIFKPITKYKDYQSATDKIEALYKVDRLDPLTLGEFEDIGYGVGNHFAKHSGELFLIDEAQPRSRKITLQQGEDRDVIIDKEYYVQNYQIVREDILRVGDKILDRGGLKGIISDIVPDLGKDKNGRQYDLICNYDEVWREADRSTKDGRLRDDTFEKQGKKKSAIVLEHEAGDGEVFFFMIDKFAQDSVTTGLSFSSTLVSGLWERALDTLESDTRENRDSLMDNFAGAFFRGEGNFIPTLKALHYKAIKENDIVRLEIDDKEPTPDDYGDVVNLPHTFAGNTYKKAYVPSSVARVYFDGRTFREVFIPQESNTPNDASDFYWYNIMRQTKNRFRLFPRLDWGIQLVTRPWCEDEKDPTKYHTVMMDYLDVLDMGADPYDKSLMVTFRKEPVTSGHSVQTHPVKIDFTGKYRGCYDTETEVLTDKGWMFFKDLNGSERIATLNSKTKELEFQLPTKVIGYEYKDKMYELKTKMLDLLVTPDHRMWVGARDSDYRIETAEEMFGKRRKFDTSAGWNGFEQEFITFPSVERVHTFSSRNQYTDFDTVRNIQFGEKTFRMDDWLEFLGYYLTEGYARKDSEIVIAQTNLENRDRIISCIQRLGYEPNVLNDSRIIFSDIVIALYLQEFGKATEKYIPREVLGLSSRQLKILYEAMMLGDGHKGSHTAFYTSSKQLSDEFQEVCLKLGMSAAIYVRESRENHIDGRLIESENLQYSVNVRQKRLTPMINYSGFEQTEEWIDYDGMVYCVEVPNHIIYVRRNGKPLWCGNTIGMNPQVALKATIDYDGDTVSVFHNAIMDAVSKLDKNELKEYDANLKEKHNKNFSDLYEKARKTKYAKDEKELGIMTAAYNQQIVESENELIEKLGGLRRRALILQGIDTPIKDVLAEGTKYEENIIFDMKTINKITDVEKILKMREPRWKVRMLENKKIDELTSYEWDLVKDSHARKRLNKILSKEIQNPNVRVLYDLIREGQTFVEETAKRRTESDPLGLKLDIKNKLIDRILYNELLGSDILEDRDKQ